MKFHDSYNKWYLKWNEVWDNIKPHGRLKKPCCMKSNPDRKITVWQNHTDLCVALCTETCAVWDCSTNKTEDCHKTNNRGEIRELHTFVVILCSLSVVVCHFNHINHRTVWTTLQTVLKLYPDRWWYSNVWQCNNYGTNYNIHKHEQVSYIEQTYHIHRILVFKFK